MQKTTRHNKQVKDFMEPKETQINSGPFGGINNRPYGIGEPAQKQVSHAFPGEGV